MSKQILFYENAKPVSKKDHLDLYVKMGKDFSFTQDTNSVPLTIAEFRQAAQEYAIVFSGENDEVLPAVILGSGGQENGYFGDGSWNAQYIPAFVRRYPFIFSSTDEGKSLLLCIDESYSGCNREEIGERLFDAEGERSQFLNTMLNFVEAYQKQYHLTRFFCKQLQELDLLEPMRANFKLPSGEQRTLAGFSVISREKLQALSGEKLEALMKNGSIELAYLHLQSMNNLKSLLEKGTDKGANTQTEAEEGVTA
ncbi:MAG: SapC family protein [Gammaproteobacteria bacterium]|nr:SapC family protein [Gammaproteobacteria bacterium]